jgi:hypothetical protein
MSTSRSGANWQALAGVERTRLGEARLQAHFAAQWLARAARACVLPRPADTHTNLGWDAMLGGLRTHRLPDRARLGLRFVDLTLAVLTGVPPDGTQQLQLDGCRDADVREWLGCALGGRGFDVRTLDAPSPYEMPAHPVARGAVYSSAGLTDALNELAAWYANAKQALDRIREQLLARGLDAPAVRCWPHHFDLDTLVYFAAKNPDDTRTMGTGFSPGDEYNDEPYFYVGIHPAPEVALLPTLPAAGHWHTHEFTAAIAPASRIIAAENPQGETEAFLDAATEIAIKMLG